MFEPVVATLITSMARTVTGARSLWLGCAPVPVQRIYFANHSSHGAPAVKPQQAAPMLGQMEFARLRLRQN